VKHRISAKALLFIAAFVLFVVPVAAIAAGDFADVADDNVFKADIDWLADTGVTQGCNPPANTRFCPGSNVTREQMAAFMHRLAENQIVDAATAVEAEHAASADTAAIATTAESAAEAGRAADADALEGKALDEIAPYVWSQTDGSLGGVNSFDVTEINSIDINAPVAGFITISGSVFISPGGAGLTDLTAKIDGVAVDPPGSTFTVTEMTDGTADYTMSYTVTMPITAGSHTVSQELFGAMPGYFHNHEYLTVMFVPTGSHESVAGLTAGTSERG
jgi:hypothetical protein